MTNPATTERGFDFEPAYRAYGYGGIAWRVTGYAQEWTREDWQYLGDEDDPDAGADDYHERTGFYYPDENPANYVYIEPEQIEDRTRVVAYMIGDDRDFTFDIDDLEPIAREDYCGQCGQIGCSHDGYDRD
jgi:hypothetical protein